MLPDFWIKILSSKYKWNVPAVLFNFLSSPHKYKVAKLLAEEGNAMQIIKQKFIHTIYIWIIFKLYHHCMLWYVHPGRTKKCIVQEMLRCFLGCFLWKITHPHSTVTQWNHVSGWISNWHVKNLLPNEHSSFFLLKQRAHRHLIDTTRCTGFNELLLAVLETWKEISPHAAMFQFNDKQRNITVRYLMIWFIKITDWGII